MTRKDLNPNSTILHKKNIIEMIGGLFILLFLYAATSKLLHYEKSELQMSKSPIISDYAFILVWLVPTTEILIATMLMWEKSRLVGFYAALSIMTAFSVYIIGILNFSSSIPCSCGGILENLTWSDHLILNIVFIVLAIVGILMENRIHKVH